ncbi:ADP-ribosylation/Crystallin J1 [Syntrophomonas zehnderi OL-4]|uniref:ADP-ribosylation/Crystallin J1 n=1 Tax=Syntrophomonas zehnderi OL-4 TaxID=690567 RepID=A0A0E3W2F1_9FIRM|nr:ADP-ribosylglycohydrolase family protein [Syntrophomonas zehnderi]CFW97016.1 ADP-ribosylation/Crystallin J1 [Syntrophomonas zehnderi OL-4]
MLGAIIGDIIGSAYEFNNTKTTDFSLFTPRSRFTDDTVLTVAVADAILHNKDYAMTIWEYGRRYPRAGYGDRFALWLQSTQRKPYRSYGNGSAMRISPVGFAYDTVEKVLAEAEKFASVTHNHPEGIKGAQAVALAIFMARLGAEKKDIKREIQTRFDYNLQRKLDDIRPGYSFDVTCQGSVPEAILAFLESENYEDAIRKAISLGGDSDTIACMSGGIAQAYYKDIPAHMTDSARTILDDDLLKILDSFAARFGQ